MPVKGLLVKLLNIFFFLNLLLWICLSNAIENNTDITLVASDSTEFRIDKEIITKLSPVIKNFVQPEFAKTVFDQTKIEFNSIKPSILGFLLEAVKLVYPLEKVLCEGKDNELHFYPFKEIKRVFEPWWQQVASYLKTSCPIATIPLFQQRYKGELLRAARYLEIEPIKKYVAYKIAQELRGKGTKEINKQLLRRSGFGDLTESSYQLVHRYFTLLQINAEEHSIADYIFEKGQPTLQDKKDIVILNGQQVQVDKKAIELSFKGITSLFGLSCIDQIKNIENLNLSANKLIELGSNELNDIPNLQALDLSNNYLTSIAPRAFIGLPNLKILSLEENKIKIIEAKTFEGLEKLSSLVLHHNLLTELKPEIFQGLKNLRWLELGANEIHIIVPGAFSGLNTLTHLVLDDNLLTHLENGVFNELNQLIFLNLNNNKLNDLGENLFDQLANLERLLLANNQLSTLSNSLFILKRDCRIILTGNKLSSEAISKLWYHRLRYNLDVEF